MSGPHRSVQGKRCRDRTMCCWVCDRDRWAQIHRWIGARHRVCAALGVVPCGSSRPMLRKPADQGGLAGTIGGDQAEIEGGSVNVWRQRAQPVVTSHRLRDAILDTGSRWQKRSRRCEPAGPRPQKLSKIAIGEFSPFMFE